MRTEKKPCIAILMAVYDPNLDWLRQQLESLNQQTYSNLRLFVRDDCSPRVPFDAVKAMVEECITAFPYTVCRNPENLGSNKTFEVLTAEGEGDYFAYCDQDDIWLPQKLELLLEDIQRTGVTMACCNLAVIDGTGKITAQTIKKARKHTAQHFAENPAAGFLFRNYVFGCACLMDAKQAKASLPMCPHYFHDHYLALWSAAHGGVYPDERVMLHYRIHGTNQTGVMLGVKDRESYEKERIQIIIDRMTWLETYFPCEAELKQTIHQGLLWAKARQENWRSHRGVKEMWRYRKLGLPVTLFELAAARMPEKLMMLVVTLLRKNII